jgi:hypothetical protein
MNKRNLTTWLGTCALLAGGLVTPSLARTVTNTPDSEQVSKLLSEAKTMAFQLKEDAVTMESYTRMNLSWQSHATAINQIKDHINALGQQVTKLKAARDTAAPWQKTAIDRINPFLDELGGYTTAVIEHINGDKKHTIADYNDYLQANADYASDLASMIADFVDYGNSRQRVDRLGAKLEIDTVK